MSTVVRAVSDERDGLLTFLAEQRDAVRRAAHGLTDEQAASAPSASSLSIGGLVKHLTRMEWFWIQVVLDGQPNTDPQTPETWPRQFRMEEGETLAGLLAAYEQRARETEEIVNALPDLDRVVPLPARPAFQNEARSARWILLHVIQEVARHAGHADIIRETLDGASASDLVDATRA
ncbi:DinB family protein [Streptoalloteichus hindustanus]|nr:DinB family protein [Streptoalloteichus hindustanus]